MLKFNDVFWDSSFHVELNNKRKLNISFPQLRYMCPCASCVDELSNKRLVEFWKVPADIKVLDCDYVGNYAIRIHWSDGHKTGIYSSDYLDSLIKD